VYDALVLLADQLMVDEDMGNLYVSHSGWDPYYTCFSISDKKIVKSHKLEPGMSHLKFINYKSTVFAVSSTYF
jgi:hypothetical protein